MGTIESSAKMLQEALQDTPDDLDIVAKAKEIVSQFAQARAIIPGIGRPIHKPIDPRTPRLFEIAIDNGFGGRYIGLMQEIEAQAQRHYDRVLPINATGAIGAVASELGIPWQVCCGLGVMARAVGLVGHILEEMREPMAQKIWFQSEEEATKHLREARNNYEFVRCFILICSMMRHNIK